MTRTFQNSRERSTRATPDSDARSLCIPVENVRNDLLLETLLSNYGRAGVLRLVEAVSSVMLLNSAPSHPHLLNRIRVRHFLSGGVRFNASAGRNSSSSSTFDYCSCTLFSFRSWHLFFLSDFVMI
jgi:hypothetical protein